MMEHQTVLCGINLPQIMHQSKLQVVDCYFSFLSFDMFDFRSLLLFNVEKNDGSHTKMGQKDVKN